MSAARLPLLCALAALALYLPSLGTDFIFDDRAIMDPASPLEKLSLWQGFFDNSWHPGLGVAYYYRPLVFLSHRFDVALWGRDPAGHHLTNLVLYALCVGLLARLFLRLGAGARRAAAVTLLFVALPSHVESVTWVSGRSDLLAACFGLLGYHALLAAPDQPRSRARTALAMLAFLAALLSKETALVYPIALVLAALWPARDGDGREAWPRLTSTLLIALVPAAIYLALRRHCAGLTSSAVLLPGSPAELALAAAVALKLAGRYAAMLVIGRDFGPTAYSEMMALRRLVPGTASALFLRELDLELALAILAVAGLALFAASRARTHAARAGLLIAVLGLAVTFRGTAREQLLFGDRYLFIPGQGAALVLALMPLPRLPRLTLVAAGALALIWSAASVERMQRYTSPFHYWEEAARLNPASPAAQANYAHELIVTGDLEAALLHLSIAHELWKTPELSRSPTNRGFRYSQLIRSFERYNSAVPPTSLIADPTSR